MNDRLISVRIRLPAVMQMRPRTLTLEATLFAADELDSVALIEARQYISAICGTAMASACTYSLERVVNVLTVPSTPNHKD